MTEDKRSRSRRLLDENVKALHLEDGHTKKETARLRTDEVKEESGSSNAQSPKDTSMKSSTQSPVKSEAAFQSPYTGSENQEEVIGGGVTVKLEPGQPPKLSRSTSQKIVSRPPLLYNDWPSKNDEAKETFQVLPQCTYSSKYIGSTEHGSMDCDCAEEWGKHESILLTISRPFQTDATSRCVREGQLRLRSGFGLHQSFD